MSEIIQVDVPFAKILKLKDLKFVALADYDQRNHGMLEIFKRFCYFIGQIYRASNLSMAKGVPNVRRDRLCTNFTPVFIMLNFSLLMPWYTT